ncbi:MAG: hypothetical protein JWN94_3681 [Betaproteobacteria bacterium]|nr:hypothetical protein [Betaproteobacteria bacterium]
MNSGLATLIAAACGAIGGGIAALMLPPDKFAWTGFVLLPLFVLLEGCLEQFRMLFGGDRNIARVTLASATVAAFYVAWFALRPV